MFSNNPKFFFLCLVFSLCHLFILPVLAEYPDLAGYWKFNGNTFDRSGNDNTGTVSGNVAYSSSGKVGQTFDFNGSTSIACGPNSSLSIADNISIEMWFYPRQWVTGYASHIVNKWTGISDANYAMYFFGTTSGSDYQKICFFANAGGAWKAVSPKYQIPSLNTWYHVVWTYNSTSGGKIYINGVAQGAAAGSGTLATNTASLKISPCFTGLYFNGLLDEVKIYNRVLSDSDVAAKVQDAQTKGYWNFHGNVLDFSGNDNVGTVSGTAAYSSGKVGQAFDFDGNTSIACGPNTSLSIADNISIEMWFYPEQWITGYATHPINKSANATDSNFVMYFFGDTSGSNYKNIGFYAKAGGVWKQVSPFYLIPSLNTWYHIVWTYSSVSGGKLYVNGTLYGSPTGSGMLATNTASLKAGRYGSNPGFRGLLDEVKIYNRVLNSADVSARYQDLGVSGAVLENVTLKLTVNSAGQITQLLDKSTGTDYKGGVVPFVKIVKAGNNYYNATSCLQKNGRLLFDFGTANVTAEITTKIMASYFVFQVYALYGDTSNLNGVRLIYIYPRGDATYNDWISGIMGDNSFVIAGRAMNAKTLMSGSVFPCVAMEPAYGLELAKCVLLGCFTSNLKPALQAMLVSEGLPTSSMGGPSALDAPINKYSYIFARGDISTSAVNTYINLANTAGSKIINFYNCVASMGHYAPRSDMFPNGLNDMKDCVTALHNAGLKAGFHSFTNVISSVDPYVTPLADTRLYKDAKFTLSSAIGTADTAIYVNEQPLSTLSTTGNVLQIGNELIRYTDYTQTVPYRFTGCTRGAYSTTKQSHAVGASVGHLYGYGGWFYPDPATTLLDEIAGNIANVINTCDFDMIYLDAAEAGTDYMRLKMGTAILSRIKKPVRVEAACPFHGYWPFLSNMGAWDFPLYGSMNFIDGHVLSVSDCYRDELMPCQLGWWSFLGFTDNYYSQLPEEVEYLCAKSLGCDASLSFPDIPLSNNERQNEYLQTVKLYEDLRAAGLVSDTVKTQLKTVGSEFHITQTGTIIKRDNLTHKVTSLNNGSNFWTVNNSFNLQPAKFRIRALHASLAASYDNGPNISVADFQNTGDFLLTNASNVTSSLSVDGGICTYTAANNSGTPVGAWTKASKAFSPVLNICGGYETLGVWVNGDNKGEVLNFQLCQSSANVYDDHYVVVNFTGWKYFELFLRERDASADYKWPYSSIFNVYRFAVTRSNIPNFNIYYNNLPVGQQVSCQIKPVKALLTESINITNPSITIGGTTVSFPVTLLSGQYLEFYSTSNCKLYDKDGTLLNPNVIPTGTQPTLTGYNDNTVIFSGTGTAGYNTRANVTMFIDGDQIYP